MELAPPPPPGPRVEELGERVIVRFRPRRSWGEIVFLVFWLTVWTAVGLGTLSYVGGSESDERVFSIVWLCGWAVGECAVFGVLAWPFFGRELLTVTTEALELRKELGRFSRTRRYETALVRTVEAAQVPGNDEDRRPRSDFGLVLAYREETVRVGEGMGAREAEEVAALVLAKIRWQEGWIVGGDERGGRTQWGFGRDEMDAPADRIEPRHRENARAPTGRWRGGVALAAVVGLVVAVHAVLPDERDDGSRPARPRSPGPPPSTTSGPAGPPSPEQFSDARAYAAAMTRYSLRGARSEVLGRPDCGRAATWTRWSCTVTARAKAGPYAGRALTYRCRALPPEQTGANPPTRVTVCGPKDPPPLSTTPTTAPG